MSRGNRACRRRGCHEDASRKLLPRNSSFTPLSPLVPYRLDAQSGKKSMTHALYDARPTVTFPVTATLLPLARWSEATEGLGWGLNLPHLLSGPPLVCYSLRAYHETSACWGGQCILQPSGKAASCLW